MADPAPLYVTLERSTKLILPKNVNTAEPKTLLPINKKNQHPKKKEEKSKTILAATVVLKTKISNQKP